VGGVGVVVLVVFGEILERKKFFGGRWAGEGSGRCVEWRERFSSTRRARTKGRNDWQTSST